jgi:hypothetical protein
MTEPLKIDVAPDAVDAMLSAHWPADPDCAPDRLWLPASERDIRQEPGGTKLAHPTYTRGQKVEVRMRSRDWDVPEHVSNFFWVQARFVALYEYPNSRQVLQVYVWPTVHLGDGWDMIPGKVERYFEADVRAATLDGAR